MGKVEKQVRLGVNILAAIVYALIAWAAFESAAEDQSTGMTLFIIFVMWLLVLIVHKVLGAIFGSMASAFDGTVGEVGKAKE